MIKRPYITIGVATWLLLLPLALTSTDAMVRRLGGKRWRNLHQLIYVAGGTGALHYLWLVKADTFDPLVYLVLFTALLTLRLPSVSRRLPALTRRTIPTSARTSTG